LAREALARTASLKHVVVGVGGQLVEAALRHVAVARVAHHVCVYINCTRVHKQNTRMKTAFTHQGFPVCNLGLPPN